MLVLWLIEIVLGANSINSLGESTNASKAADRSVWISTTDGFETNTQPPASETSANDIESSPTEKTDQLIGAFWVTEGLTIIYFNTTDDAYFYEIIPASRFDEKSIEVLEEDLGPDQTGIAWLLGDGWAYVEYNAETRLLESVWTWNESWIPVKAGDPSAPHFQVVESEARPWINKTGHRMRQGAYAGCGPCHASLCIGCIRRGGQVYCSIDAICTMDCRIDDTCTALISD